MPKTKDTVTVTVSTTSAPAPKKSTSAYMLFCNEERQRVKQDLPSLTNTQIVTELGKRWKLLGDSDPSRLEKLTTLAKSDQERYKTEKAALPKPEKVKAAPKPKAEAPEPKAETPAPPPEAEKAPKPKKPRRAKETVATLESKEPDTKDVVVQAPSAPEISSDPSGSTGKAKKVKKPKASSEAAPEAQAPVTETKQKNRVTAYINYSNTHREATKAANPGLAPKDIMRQLAIQWNALTDAEKEKYKV